MRRVTGRMVMRTAIRTALAILAGLVSAFVLVVAVELFSAVVHPTPADFDGTQEEMCGTSHAISAVGAGRGRRGVECDGIRRHVDFHAIRGDAGGSRCRRLLFVGLAFNVAMLPYPVWFKIVMLVALPAACAWGLRLANRKNRQALARADSAAT